MAQAKSKKKKLRARITLPPSRSPPPAAAAPPQQPPLPPPPPGLFRSYPSPGSVARTPPPPPSMPRRPLRRRAVPLALAAAGVYMFMRTREEGSTTKGERVEEQAFSIVESTSTRAGVAE